MNAPSDASSARPSRVTVLVLGGLIALMALRVWIAAWDYAVTSPRLPHWDAASRAIIGIRMAEALRHLDPLAFLRIVFDSSPWPPLFHLLEAPLFMIFGEHYHVAAAPIPFLLFASILAAYALGVSLGGVTGMVVGAIGAVLMAASTMYQVFGGLIMLEVPGALLMLLALTCYVRYRRFGSLRDARLAAVLTCVLFFVKYNYPTFLVVPIVLNELGHDLPSLGRLREMALRQLAHPRWRSPFWLLIALGVVLLGVLAANRHGTISLAGRRIVVPGLRDPVLVLLGLLALRFAWRWGANLRAARAWFAGLRPAVRSFLAIGILPPALWLLMPSHLKMYFSVMANRSSRLDPLSAESLLFYPRSFLFDYSPTPLLGLVVLVLGLAAVALIPRLSPERRILPLALAVGLALTTAHPFKIDRFFFLVAPLIWMSCGLTVALLAERLNRSWVPSRAVLAQYAIGAVAVACGVTFGFDGRKADAYFDRSSSSEKVNVVLDEICRVNRSSRGTLLLGTWNELSTGLVEWYQHYHLPGGPGPRRPKNPLWYDDLAPDRLLGRIARDPEVERVMVLDLPPQASAYHASFTNENGWLVPVAAAIARTPGFRLEASREFEDTGYRLLVYRKLDGAIGAIGAF